MAGTMILSTKKIKPALKEKALLHNIEISDIEFIQVKTIETPGLKTKAALAIQNNGNIIFTSANAVESLNNILGDNSSILINKNLFCIAGKTRSSAEKIFPGNMIKAVGENSTSLAAEIIRSGEKDLLFFCGNKRRKDLPQLLAEAGISIEEIELYKTEETAERINDNFAGILFFSPSAVSSFFRKNKPIEQTVCFAIGEATAEAIRMKGNYPVITASFPDPVNMIDKLIDHFKQ
jgi:uroporphyrinogen-III synthase